MPNVRGLGILALSLLTANVVSAASEPAEPRCLYGAADVNADGYADMIAADVAFDEVIPKFGVVRLVSSADGTGFLSGDELLTLTSPEPNDLFGRAAQTAGDVDGDGKHDIIVGAHFSNLAGVRAGRAYVYSGASGQILFTFSGESAGDGFGYTVSTAEDVNHDGRDDILIGAPWRDQNGLTDCGKVYCYSGATGALLWSHVGDMNNRLLGYSVSRLGRADVIPNATVQVVVGGPGVDTPVGATIPGQALILAGHTGAVVHAIPPLGWGDLLGYCVARAGDIDHDGVQDAIVSAPRYSVAAGRRGGVNVVSGRTGAIIRQHFAAPGGGTLGVFVAGVRDFDYVDDRDDYEIVSAGSLSGSNWWTEGDPPPIAERTWVRSTYFSGPTGLPVYETLSFPFAEAPASDTDGDGTVSMTDVQTLVASWGLQVCCGTSDGDVDGDGGVGSGDMTIVLTNFGLAAESITCDPNECGPGTDLTPQQKCRRAANRRLAQCVQYDLELVVGALLACTVVCGGTSMFFPTFAIPICATCYSNALKWIGIPTTFGIIAGCGRGWWHEFRAC